MPHRLNEIEELILSIERAEMVAGDSTTDDDVRAAELVEFVRNNSKKLIARLDDLKEFIKGTMNSDGTSSLSPLTHRAVLEGFSDKSAEEALSSALDKAARYFSENGDVVITVQQLQELPNGGHHAIIEVRTTPVTLRDTAHLKGLDIVLKREKAKTFSDLVLGEDEKLRRLVFDHFSALTDGAAIDHIPQEFLINVTDAKLLHYMIEKAFLKAEHAREVQENREPSRKRKENTEAEHILVRRQPRG